VSDRALAGAVLTGGASRRMGRDKAFVEVHGEPMVRRVAAALAAAGCDPVVAVGGDGAALRAAGLAWVPDRWPGEGPLGAIVTALRHTGIPTIVVATDLAFLDADCLAALVAAAGPGDPGGTPDGDGAVDVVVADSGRPEPLCALWRPSSLVALERARDSGERAVHAVFASLRVREVAVDPAGLRNVNRPGDLPG
jgi:molybdopterin-guanine dinucleotide biosynthesis protein A